MSWKFASVATLERDTNGMFLHVWKRYTRSQITSTMLSCYLGWRGKKKPQWNGGQLCKRLSQNYITVSYQQLTDYYTSWAYWTVTFVTFVTNKHKQCPIKILFHECRLVNQFWASVLTTKVGLQHSVKFTAIFVQKQFFLEYWKR